VGPPGKPMKLKSLSEKTLCGQPAPMTAQRAGMIEPGWPHLSSDRLCGFPVFSDRLRRTKPGCRRPSLRTTTTRRRGSFRSPLICTYSITSRRRSLWMRPPMAPVDRAADHETRMVRVPHATGSAQREPGSISAPRKAFLNEFSQGSRQLIKGVA